MKLLAFIFEQPSYTDCFHTTLTVHWDILHQNKQPGPEVIKLLLCSTQLSIKLIMLINVKMPTNVGILTFVSMINKTYEHLKARKVFIFQHFSFYEQLKFHAQLS